jgi:hypothetical protein
MGFDALIRSGVALADSLTKQGLQATVSHEAWTGQNAYGEASYGAVVSRRAVVTDATTLVRDDKGDEVVARYRILFLGDVTVGPLDRLTLPSGRVTPILRVDSGVLADDATKFVTEVWCG